MEESISTQRPSRAHERHAFSGSVTILSELGGEPVAVRALDLSEGGCFVLAPLSFQVGEVVALCVDLDDGPPLLLFGVVAHRRRAAKGQLGYGISFADLSREERASIARTCSRLPPQMPAPAVAKLFG